MTQIHQLTAEQVYFHFISDCLWPSLDNAVSAAVLFDLWTQYCQSIGYAPGGVQVFGRLMASRYQRTTRRGRSFYYCEIKPDIFEQGEVNGQNKQEESENEISGARPGDSI